MLLNKTSFDRHRLGSRVMFSYRGFLPKESEYVCLGYFLCFGVSLFFLFLLFYLFFFFNFIFKLLCHTVVSATAQLCNEHFVYMYICSAVWKVRWVRNHSYCGLGLVIVDLEMRWPPKCSGRLYFLSLDPSMLLFLLPKSTASPVSGWSSFIIVVSPVFFHQSLRFEFKLDC